MGLHRKGRSMSYLLYDDWGETRRICFNCSQLTHVKGCDGWFCSLKGIDRNAYELMNECCRNFEEAEDEDD